MSKDTKPAAFAIRTSGDDVDVTALKEDQTVADVNAAETNPYVYNDYNDETEEGDDNYSLKKNDAGTAFDKKRVDDYKTRESLSVKSNQLAYIPPYLVNEKEIDNGEITVEWPELLIKQSFIYKDDTGTEQTTTFEHVFADYKKIPVVKSVVGGNNYYFYDFSDIDSNLADAFMENYAKLFSVDPSAPAGTRSFGDLSDLYDITNWKYFKVKSILVDDNKVYTNSAISVKKATDTKLTVKGNKDSILPLFNANKDLDLSLGYTDTEAANASKASNVTTKIRER